MTNKQLQDYLKQFADNMPIKLLHDVNNHKTSVVSFDTENILLTSETAYVDGDAPEDEWNTEDGKVRLGDGQQYLLFNPIIL